MTYLVLIASVVVGVLLVQFVKDLKGNAIKLLLAFSGAYLFAISIFHLLPEIYTGDGKRIGLFVIAGFILQIVLEFFSKGIEHGHSHLHSKAVPISMLISLAIHAYLEGMPLGGVDHHGHSHAHFEDSLLTGIALHKIPVTIVLMSLFAQAGFSRAKSFVYIGIFAFMAPLGTLSGNLMHELGHYHREIMAIVTGIFLHISTTILFESSEGHKFNIQKFVVITVGSLLAWFV
ncbi:MAG: ZIP family metal transporter [Flavobacteriales bacterium]|nr:ZIP family metal transporter [Flavobacteriales bacterium]